MLRYMPWYIIDALTIRYRPVDSPRARSAHRKDFLRGRLASQQYGVVVQSLLQDRVS